MALTAILACNESGDGEQDAGTDTEVAREPAEPPVFLQPASGTLMLRADRVDDVVLRVDGINPVSTRFVLDGTSYGDLSAVPWLGALGPDTLTLRVRGGLVSAGHTFFLETPSVDEPARSQEIAVDIVVEAEPSLAVSLGTTEARRGRAVGAFGIGETSVLLVYDESGETPRIEAFRSRTGGSPAGWDLTSPLSVPVVRLPTVNGVVPWSAALTTQGTEQLDDDRLRLAWRQSNERIELIDRLWGGTPTQPQTAFALDQLDTTSFEFASLGRPFLVGDALLVETNLLTDTAAPRPGDRRVTSIPLRGAPAEPGTPRLSAPLGVVDIDRIGPALDPRVLAVDSDLRPHRVAARVQGARAAVFDVDATTGALRLQAMSDALSGWQTAGQPAAAVLGALGSRTMLGVADGTALVQAFNDSAGSTATDASTGLVGGGTARDAGTPAVTVLGGYPIMLLPMGAEHPVMAVTVSGARVNTQVLDTLRCDEIAVPTLAASVVGMSVQFACRGNDEIRFGTIALAL